MHASFDITETFAGMPHNRLSAGHEAIEGSNKRRSPPTRVRHEDSILKDRKRDTMTATVHDTVRNFTLVSWMVRKHLDYTTSFTPKFKVRLPNGELNKPFNDELEAFVANWSKKENCHASRRHPLRRLMRIAEARKLFDGDFGLLKLTADENRGKIQGFETDLIASPKKPKSDERWLNGVLLDDMDGATHYGLHKRTSSGRNTEFVTAVEARHMILHAHFESSFRHDQVRGTSAISSAVNDLRDTHEIKDYAKAKAKVAQLFGLWTKRDDDSIQKGLKSDEEHEEEQSREPGDPIDVDFSDGPAYLDLFTNEEAGFLENKTNSGETVEMLRFLMQVCAMTLDLPISVLDERETTFFGGRGAMMNYLKSCGQKICDNKEVVSELIMWRLAIAIVDGELMLPSGLMFEDIVLELVPAGVPWWDPVKELKAQGMAIGACLTNWDAVIKELYGGDTSFAENLEINAAYYQAAKDVDFPLTLPGVTASAVDQITESVEDTNAENA